MSDPVTPDPTDPVRDWTPEKLVRRILMTDAPTRQALDAIRFSFDRDERQKYEDAMIGVLEHFTRACLAADRAQRGVTEEEVVERAVQGLEFAEDATTVVLSVTRCEMANGEMIGYVDGAQLEDLLIRALGASPTTETTNG